MNSILKEIKHYLNFYPRFRERKNKNELIAILIIKRFSLNVPVKIVQDALVYGESLDRAWRQALQRDTKLRGIDYEEKAKLEIKKKVELGYPNPDHNAKPYKDEE